MHSVLLLCFFQVRYCRWDIRNTQCRHFPTKSKRLAMLGGGDIEKYKLRSVTEVNYSVSGRDVSAIERSLKWWRNQHNDRNQVVILKPRARVSYRMKSEDSQGTASSQGSRRPPDFDSDRSFDLAQSVLSPFQAVAKPCDTERSCWTQPECEH